MEPETHERKDVRRNREAVIEAALAILPDDPNASMATIAERSGLGRTTVYRHFPARNDLLLALFARVIDEARAVTSAVIEEGLPAAETLRALGPPIITIPDRFRFLHEVRSVGEEMIAETTVDPNAPVRQFLEAAQRRGEINADLPIIKNPRAFARQHVDQFLLGAAAPERAGRKPSARRAASRRGPS